jgi:hypothetical protein
MTDITDDVILPCPICGYDPLLVDFAGWEIVCKCGISMCLETSDKKSLIEAWNQREHQAMKIGISTIDRVFQLGRDYERNSYRPNAFCVEKANEAHSEYVGIRARLYCPHPIVEELTK